MATATANVGVQSSLDVNQSPVIPMQSAMAAPSTWSVIWFAVALLVILGFHIRLFGRAVPPSANFP